MCGVAEHAYLLTVLISEVIDGYVLYALVQGCSKDGAFQEVVVPRQDAVGFRQRCLESIGSYSDAMGDGVEVLSIAGPF